MITIKLPYNTSKENKELIKRMQNQQSCVIRFAFNRYLDGYNEKEIRHLAKALNNIELIDSWFIQSGIKDANYKFLANKAQGLPNVIFGGKGNFKKRSQHKISNEEWKEFRLLPLVSQGEALKNGNRKWTFKIIEENKLVFKPNRNTKIKIFLPKLRANYRKQLWSLQRLAENKVQPVTISIDQQFIYFCFEEQMQKIPFRTSGNYMGIDLNPNYIACTLFNEKKELVKSWSWNLFNCTSKRNENKTKHETIEIAKEINKLALEHNVSFIFLEDLNIKAKDQEKGAWYNQQVNNKWKRNLFVNNLKKRCRLDLIKLYEVNPAYSSFIGNIMHDYPDPIAASCEIARRGYECIIQKLKIFYPKLQVSSVQDHWKKMVQDNEFESWVKFYNFVVKNLKLKYRVSWSEDYVFRFFRSIRSKISYTCYNYASSVT